MREYKQLGAYGLVIKNNKILLIKKFSGPYHGKLDLPGGTIAFCERPEDALVKVHHTGIFFKVSNYNNEIKREVKVDEVNDDSLGAEFYDIDKLSKKELSAIAIMELEKLGYILN